MVSLTSMDVDVSVTVNGVAFDQPSQVHYTDEGEIPSCNLVFPAGSNSKYKVTKKDKVRVFIGLDGTPEYARFTGHLKDEGGMTDNVMTLIGSLNRGVDDKRFVTDYDNLDGLEIGQAVYTVFKSISELSWMTCYVEATSPARFVPTDFRFENGISKYDLIKKLTEMATDPTDPLSIGRYCTYQHGDNFHFRKIPDPASVTSPSVTLVYSEDLMDINPESTMRFAYNRSVVKGKDGVLGTFENDHRIAIDGLSEADIISSDDIPNAGSAYETARANVLSNMLKKAGADVMGHNLMYLMPNYSVVAISGAPYGLSDDYLLKSLTIDITEASFNVSGSLDIPVDLLSTNLSRLLQVSGTGSSGLALPP